MNVKFSDIGLNTDITLINVSKMSSKTCDVFYLFDCFTQAGIDVDMISQPASRGADIPLSFTIHDTALTKAITALGSLKTVYPEIRTEISPGNFKVHFTSTEMVDQPGVAAFVFGEFSKADIDIKMITTSEIDISLLIDHTQYDNALDVLLHSFGKAL